jgi:hypothetical protein
MIILAEEIKQKTEKDRLAKIEADKKSKFYNFQLKMPFWNI